MSKKNVVFPHKIHVKAKHKKFASYESRLNSMENWPCGLKQTGKLMAEAGFFYDNFADQVTCHFCGIILQQWEQEDDVWSQHVLWNGTCNFIELTKGKEYVEKAEARLKLSGNKFRNNKITDLAAWACENRKKWQDELDRLKSEEKECESTRKKLIKNFCSVCLEEEANVLFVPCNHITCCIADTVCVDSCPICRTKIEASFRVYFA